MSKSIFNHFLLSKHQVSQTFQNQSKLSGQSDSQSTGALFQNSRPGCAKLETF